MNSLKWQSIDTRRDYFLSCIMYNCIHGKAPVRLCNEVEMVFDRHGFNTRLANTLNDVLPKPNLECFKNCFRYAGGKIWNSLPSAFEMLTLSMFLNVCTRTIFLNPCDTMPIHLLL